MRWSQNWTEWQTRIGNHHLSVFCIAVSYPSPAIFCHVHTPNHHYSFTLYHPLPVDPLAPGPSSDRYELLISLSVTPELTWRNFKEIHTPNPMTFSPSWMVTSNSCKLFELTSCSSFLPSSVPQVPHPVLTTRPSPVIQNFIFRPRFTLRSVWLFFLRTGNCHPCLWQRRKVRSTNVTPFTPKCSNKQPSF